VRFAPRGPVATAASSCLPFSPAAHKRQWAGRCSVVARQRDERLTDHREGSASVDGSIRVLRAFKRLRALPDRAHYRRPVAITTPNTRRNHAHTFALVTDESRLAPAFQSHVFPMFRIPTICFRLAELRRYGAFAALYSCPPGLSGRQYELTLDICVWPGHSWPSHDRPRADVRYRSSDVSVRRRCAWSGSVAWMNPANAVPDWFWGGRRCFVC
jgi:hypothetical protein